MQGYQVTFFTQQNRRHGNAPIVDWLMEIAKSIGINGVTTMAGAEGIGRSGTLHSAHFFELADQPVEVTMAVTQAQCDSLFARLEEEAANIFFAKTEVDFGVTGKPQAE